jgi:hypothetical protein
MTEIVYVEAEMFFFLQKHDITLFVHVSWNEAFFSAEPQPL